MIVQVIELKLHKTKPQSIKVLQNIQSKLSNMKTF